jgi:von Willebrand factor type A domain-containing protein
MKIVCIHCGGEFTISPQDLGGQGRCPHCHGTIALPKAATPARAETKPPRQRPTNWLEGSISGLISLVLHTAVFILVALFQATGGQGGAGEGEDVLIGALPKIDLIDRPEEQLTVNEVEKKQAADSETAIDIEVPTPRTSAATGATDLSPAALSASGGEIGNFDLGSVRISGSAAGGGGGSWEGLVGTLRRTGLDIVICFDSTGSMGGEIEQVKRQIERIGQTLVTLIPKTRISICTYRDRGDEYVVKGLPLTSNIQEVSSYLARVRAAGGEDHPEAVDEGLYWSTSQNQFRPTARKVILLFGDAPPHRERLQRCLQIATDYRKNEKGIISTVTCRNSAPLDEFYQIAMAGGGEAFLTSNQREIMTQLMVLVFGSQHRQKVMEAFKLLER